MTGKILSEIGKDLPTAAVNKMVVGKTSVDVEVRVRDQLDEQLTGTWFNNEKLGNLLKLVVVMSKSEEATNILSLGNDAIGLCDKTVGRIERQSLSEEIVRLTKPHLLGGSRAGLTREKNRILNLIDRNTEVKILNLSKDFKGSINDIIRSEKQEIEGMEISNIYYDMRYSLEPDEDHVSIFSYVKMDIRDFGERFSIDTSKAGLDAFNGEVSSEKVITSNSIVRRSRVFFRNGRTFNGPVRYSFRNGRYLTDLQGSNFKLETRLIRNPKIIDEREIMSVRDIRSQFDNLSLAVLTKNKVSRDNLESRKVPSYFSPLYHTKDENDNVRFMFSVNTSEILIRNSIYGPLFSRLSFAKRQDILERSLIKNLEVRKVRVKKASFTANNLNTNQTKGEIFDKNEPPVTLGRTGEKEPRSFPPVNNSEFSISEEDPYFGYNRGDTSVRSFSGIDKTFSTISDGFYQYEIEIEVSDTIPDYLEGQISELKEAISILNEYYNFGTLISPTLEKAEISNPHVDLDVESGSTESPDKSHYEAYSNKFTRRFSKVAREKYESPSNYPWVTVPAAFVDLVSGFVSNFPEEKKAQIVSSMRHSMSPVTGNPTNILLIIKMMESFTKKVEDISALPSKPSISSASSTSSTNLDVQKTSKSPTKSYTEYKRFDATFNSDSTKSFGFNYFDTDLGNTSDMGLKTLTNLDYDKRIDEETERFFTSKDVDINPSVGNNTATRRTSIETASYGYLTPVSFMDGKVVYDFTQEKQRPRGYHAWRRKMAKDNDFMFLLERIVTNSTAKDVLDRNGIFSNEYSVTISPLGSGNHFSCYPDQKSHRRVSTPKLQSQLSVIELYDYILKEKSNEDNVRTQLLSPNQRRVRGKKRSNPFKSVDIVSQKNNWMKIKTLQGQSRWIRSPIFSGLPNQLKAIFLRNAQNNHDAVTGEFLENISRNYDHMGSVEYGFTVGKLSRVSFLRGYRRTRKGGVSVKSPIWRTLDKRMYDRLAGKSILCRVRPYSSKSTGYSQTPGLDVNVYNEYFILDIQRDTVIPDGDTQLPEDQEASRAGQQTAPDAVAGAEQRAGVDTGADASTGAGSGTGADSGTVADAGADSEDSDGTGADSRRQLSDMTPQEISDLDLSRYSDEEISKLNALQLASVPESRRRRLSRRRSRVSRNNLMCIAMADENESEEFRNANARTSVVPNRSIRTAGKTSSTPSANAQSGDVY